MITMKAIFMKVRFFDPRAGQELVKEKKGSTWSRLTPQGVNILTYKARMVKPSGLGRLA
jgi:hypothetical protein